MMNFDFFQPFKHANYSVGVFYMTLLNLPRSLRFKRENIILVGILPAIKRGTSLNPFLKPIVDDLEELWKNGFQSRSAIYNRIHTFKAALLCVACDLPAARKVCGFLSHAAKRGCSKCYKLFDGDFGCRDYSGFDRDKWKKRNDHQHGKIIKKLLKCNTQDELNENETKFGVRFSLLTNLSYFSAVRFCIIDPMHNLYLGTAKRMVEVWTEKKLISEKQLIDIQKRIDSVEVASDVGRIPSKIASSFHGFTADQWKNWTNLFSVYALKDILPQDHMECWRQYVLASRILTSRILTLCEIQEADRLLLSFCKSFEQLYGTNLVTPNMHLHCHLKECILDYGPVFSFWCFTFERYNGILGNYHTNQRSIEVQLMRKFLRDSQLLEIESPSEYNAELSSLIRNKRKERGSLLTSNIDPHIAFSTLNCASKELREISEWQVVKELYDMHLPKHLKVFDSAELRHLTQAYETMYPHLNATDVEIPRSFSRYKGFSFAGEYYGSELSKSERSSLFLASWVGTDGSILTGGTLRERPCKVAYYFIHNITYNGSIKPHLFAKVHWFQALSDEVRLMYGSPVEVWCPYLYEIDGPSNFIPVQRLKCKFISAIEKHRGETVMCITAKERWANV